MFSGTSRVLIDRSRKSLLVHGTLAVILTVPFPDAHLRRSARALAKICIPWLFPAYLDHQALIGFNIISRDGARRFYKLLDISRIEYVSFQLAAKISDSQRELFGSVLQIIFLLFDIQFPI
jgi:hypothetical protein